MRIGNHRIYEIFSIKSTFTIIWYTYETAQRIVIVSKEIHRFKMNWLSFKCQFYRTNSSPQLAIMMGKKPIALIVPPVPYFRFTGCLLESLNALTTPRKPKLSMTGTRRSLVILLIFATIMYVCIAVATPLVSTAL